MFMFNPLSLAFKQTVMRLILIGCLAAVCWCTPIVANPPPSSQPPAGAIAEAAEREIQGFELSFPAMGTLVTLKAFHTERSEVETAFQAAQQRVHELAAILTDYDPASETRQLTQRAAGKPAAVSEDLWKVLEACDHWNQVTHGTFDASLGSVTRLWRSYRRSRKRPTQMEISQALELCGWQHVLLDTAGRTVEFDKPGIRLDFGGIGKGYIVDQAFGILQAHGLPMCLVNISGNMRAGQAPPNRQGWRIQIAPLEQGGKPLRNILLANQAIATSGDLWQFIEIDGQRRSHILDPQTGYGVIGPICATVIAGSATQADALATAACIADFDAMAEIAAEYEGVRILVADRISQDQATPQVKTTAGFPE